MDCKYAPVSCNEGGKVGSEQGQTRQFAFCCKETEKKKEEKKG